jgi:hypothetical protein
VDISDPENPFQVGCYNPSGYVKKVKTFGNYAYIYEDEYNWGFSILDISNPTNPLLIRHFSILWWWFIAEIDIEGGYLYLACLPHGLRIININHPTTPYIAGYFLTPGYASGIDIVNNYVYCADGDTGLLIIDVSNPATPHLMGLYSIPGGATNVEIWNGYAYVIDDDEWLRVIDVNNVGNPFEVGNYDISCYAYSLAVSDAIAYIGQQYYFGIYDCSQTLTIGSLSESTFSTKLGDGPVSFKLYPPSPNPFNPTTTITFDLPVASEVSLKVSNISGREIVSLVTGHLSIGKHQVVWNAEGLPSGVYFVRLSVDGGQSAVQKVVLMK